MSKQEVRTAVRVEVEKPHTFDGAVVLAFRTESGEWMVSLKFSKTCAEAEKYVRQQRFRDYRVFRLPADDEEPPVPMPEELKQALQVLLSHAMVSRGGYCQESESCGCSEHIIRRAMVDSGAGVA